MKTKSNKVLDACAPCVSGGDVGVRECVTWRARASPLPRHAQSGRCFAYQEAVTEEELLDLPISKGKHKYFPRKFPNI